MIETQITILINRKSDIDLVKQKIIENKIQFPIYIFEYEHHYQMSFMSNYEEWELDSSILECFPEYELTSNLEKGKKEIRLQLSRYQSRLSTDNWGRQIEDPLDETKYLIKKSNNKPKKFSPEIKVLFEEKEESYFINIIEGINKTSGEKGFLLLNEFKNESGRDNTDFLKDRLYKNPLEAFHFGYYKIQELVNQDFKEYIENKKKKLIEQQKLPRKIIRNFINSCNKYEIEGILKNLDENIIFEKRKNWKTTLKVQGITELEKYFKSPDQELCSKNLKIRSNWNFNSSNITIGVKYFPTSSGNEKEILNTLQYRQISFIFKDDKVISIIEEN